MTPQGHLVVYYSYYLTLMDRIHLSQTTINTGIKVSDKISDLLAKANLIKLQGYLSHFKDHDMHTCKCKIDEAKELYKILGCNLGEAICQS